MRRKRRLPPAVETPIDIAAPPTETQPAASVEVIPLAPPRLPKGCAATSARRARTLAEAAELTRNMLR